MKYFFLFAFLFCTTFHFSFAQNCPDIENHVVVNGDDIFFVKNCILHPIDDVQIYNKMFLETNDEPIEISDERYSKLSIGGVYIPEVKAPQIADMCLTYNQKIVSSDNISFYYIENCRKRKFLNFSSVELFRNTNASTAIYSIPDFELRRIKIGPYMFVQKLNWKTEKTALQILETLPQKSVICKKVQNMAPTPFVSYYGSIFYFQNCTLHQITNITIDMQKQAENGGGIYELSTQDILTLPQGAQWNNKN